MQYSGALATETQIQSEKRALAIFSSPEVRALRPHLRSILESDPAAETQDGANAIEHLLDIWSLAHIMWQLAGDATPQPLWLVDDSPHTWFGHTMPGMGGAGDNPDHIYRSAFLDGNSTYEIRGKLSGYRPAQTSFEILHGTPGKAEMEQQTSRTPDLGNQISFLMDSGINFESDGSFAISVGPDPDPAIPNHLKTEPGTLQLWIREVLSDWRQGAATIEITKLGGPAASPPLTDEQLTEKVVEDLPGFLKFWSGFKTNWLGGIQDNQLVGPSPRTGGWGYLAGGKFHLDDDEAIVITADDVGSGYLGFQILDPWLMMPVDARAATVSLGPAQIERNPDGTVTYVISSRDPGVPNWIDTTGLRDGRYIIRWVNVPEGADVDAMVRGFDFTRLSDLDTVLPTGVRGVDSKFRSAQVARRGSDFDTRLGKPIDWRPRCRTGQVGDPHPELS